MQDRSLCKKIPKKPKTSIACLIAIATAVLFRNNELIWYFSAYIGITVLLFAVHTLSQLHTTEWWQKMTDKFINRINEQLD
jgi:ABC-type siderophore export system fused ATPase/permease subunit